MTSNRVVNCCYRLCSPNVSFPVFPDLGFATITNGASSSYSYHLGAGAHSILQRLNVFQWMEGTVWCQQNHSFVLKLPSTVLTVCSDSYQIYRCRA